MTQNTEYHRPNILFITDDQHRWNLFDQRTIPNLRIPTLERLQREGTTFTNAVSCCPICLPTRMGWVHGLYPSQVAAGLLGNWHPWPVGLDSMPRALQQAGYHTALIGKLHAQGRWGDDLTDPQFVKEAQGRGFDHVMEVCGKSFSYWDSCSWTHDLEDKGLLERYRKDLERRLEQLGADEPSDASFLTREDSADGFIGRKAREWLQAYDRDQPFFLHASICGPHFPIDPPEEYHGRHRPEDMPDPVGVDDPERVAYWKRRMAAYLGMIEQVDDEIGDLLQMLEDRGFASNTLVVFTTDHGDMMGHFDLAHKGYPHDSSLRTPVILWQPGTVPAGKILDGPMESIDVPATILDFAGLGDNPRRHLRQSPGYSFRNYVLGEGPPPRAWAYAEVGYDNDGAQPLCAAEPTSKEVLEAPVASPGWRMVRETDWKYVYYPERTDALYDLINDPWETTNLIAAPEQQERISRMRMQLIESMRHCITPNRFVMGQETYVDGEYAGYREGRNR